MVRKWTWSQNVFVLVCGWIVMRADQRDGKRSQLLTQTHHREREKRGEGRRLKKVGEE